MSIYAVVARMEKVAILKPHEKENQHLKEPLDTDLNALFHSEEDSINETHCSEPSPQN